MMTHAQKTYLRFREGVFTQYGNITYPNGGVPKKYHVYPLPLGGCPYFILYITSMSYRLYYQMQSA